MHQYSLSCVQNCSRLLSSWHHVSVSRSAVLSHLKTYNLYYEGQNLQLRHREVCIHQLPSWICLCSPVWLLPLNRLPFLRPHSQGLSAVSYLLSSVSQKDANACCAAVCWLQLLCFNRKRGSWSSRACWISSGAYGDQSGCRCRMTTSVSGRHPPLRPGTQVAIWTVKSKLCRRLSSQFLEMLKQKVSEGKYRLYLECQRRRGLNFAFPFVNLDLFLCHDIRQIVS